jgi:hypothetical protein
LFRFLNLIGRTVETNWGVESGFLFLTGKLLGMSSDEFKSSQLLRMMYQCSGKHHTFSASSKGDESIERLCGYGLLIHPHAELTFAIKSLNWLFYRTMYYSLAARLHDASLALHPIRSLFSASKILPQMEIPSTLCEHVVSLLAREGMATSQKIRLNFEPSIATMTIPFFSAWIATKSDRPADFIKNMLERRDYPGPRNICCGGGASAVSTRENRRTS